jgi:hypothetical protein
MNPLATPIPPYPTAVAAITDLPVIAAACVVFTVP